MLYDHNLPFLSSPAKVVFLTLLSFTMTTSLFSIVTVCPYCNVSANFLAFFFFSRISRHFATHSFDIGVDCSDCFRIFSGQS